MDALAYNIGVTDRLICPLMDARRSQVYTGIYCYTDGMLDVIQPQEAVSVADLAQTLNELGQEVILLGDGVPVYQEQRGADAADSLVPLRLPISNRPEGCGRGRSGGALLPGGEMPAGGRDAPEYLRKSQAEREREEREKQKTDDRENSGEQKENV